MHPKTKHHTQTVAASQRHRICGRYDRIVTTFTLPPTVMAEKLVSATLSILPARHTLPQSREEELPVAQGVDRREAGSHSLPRMESIAEPRGATHCRKGSLWAELVESPHDAQGVDTRIPQSHSMSLMGLIGEAQGATPLPKNPQGQSRSGASRRFQRLRRRGALPDRLTPRLQRRLRPSWGATARLWQQPVIVSAPLRLHRLHLFNVLPTSP